MASRRPNHRLVKIHYNYTVEEAARVCSVHRNTVRAWIAAGLQVCDAKRPLLILGRHLKQFLEARRKANKRPCQPGQVYCVRCRWPKTPAGGMADYRPVTQTAGDLEAICPTCEAMIYRRVTLSKLDQVRGEVEVRMPQALSPLRQSDELSANSDFRQGGCDRADAQRQ